MQFRLATAIVLATGLTAVASAEDLRPLADVVKQEQSAAMLMYVLKRCSSVYYAAAFRAGPSDDPERQSVFVSSKTMAERFMGAAFQLATKAKLPDTDKTLLDEITLIGKDYTSMMQRSYLSTGNAFSSQIRDDMSVCRGLL